MHEARRTFFGKAAAGMAAVVGLFLPGRAAACFRRRVACAPPPPPPGDVFAPAVVVRPADERAVVNIDYPDEPNVPGGGGFYTWGSTNGVSGITAKCGAGTVTPVAVPGTDTWAFLINGLPVGVPVTLTIFFNDMGIAKPGQSINITPR